LGLAQHITSRAEKRWGGRRRVGDGERGNDGHDHQRADLYEQRRHEALLGNLPHRGLATHSTSSYTSWAHAAAPKRLNVWINFAV
jgi:hypothetical protein